MSVAGAFTLDQVGTYWCAPAAWFSTGLIFLSAYGAGWLGVRTNCSHSVSQGRVSTRLGLLWAREPRLGELLISSSPSAFIHA